VRRDSFVMQWSAIPSLIVGDLVHEDEEGSHPGDARRGRDASVKGIKLPMFSPSVERGRGRNNLRTGVPTAERSLSHEFKNTSGLAFLELGEGKHLAF
jgi:hypothetical protein